MIKEALRGHSTCPSVQSKISYQYVIPDWYLFSLVLNAFKDRMFTRSLWNLSESSPVLTVTNCFLYIWTTAQILQLPLQLCCLQLAGHIAGHCLSAKARAAVNKHRDYWLCSAEEALLVHSSLIFAFFVTTWHSWLMLREQSAIIPRSSPFGQLFPILYLCSWWLIHNWSTFHLPFNLVLLDQILIISCYIQGSLVTATWSIAGHRLIFCGQLFLIADLCSIVSVCPYSFYSTDYRFLSSDFHRFAIWWVMHFFLIHIIRPKKCQRRCFSFSFFFTYLQHT